jgi:hypothetical protein
MSTKVPGIWVHSTDSAYDRARALPYAAWLSPVDQARLERIRQGQMLFDGRHREYYLDEGRTQFDFPEVRVATGSGDAVRRMYVTYNLLGLISYKGADLLMGQPPVLVAADAGQQAALSELADRTALHRVLYQACVDSSYEGEAFLECVIDTASGRPEVYIQQLPADEMFPVGRMGFDGQYAAYRRITLAEKQVEGRTVKYALETTYQRGSITRAAFVLADEGQRQQVSLAEFPSSPPLTEVTPTLISANTVTWIPNMLSRGRVVSDYDGAQALQDEVNAKTTQLARVLAKHSDPKLALPAEAADPKTGTVRSDAEAYFYRTGEQLPSYITWNAELESAIKDRAFAVNALLIMTETSPVLLGLKEGAAPDAYKKVRLESLNSVQRGMRKATLWASGVKRLLNVAQELEQFTAAGGYAMGPISVEFRDGLPIDEGDLADTISTHRAAGTMSRRRALTLQLGDPAAVDAELAELEREAAGNRAQVILGELTSPPAAEPGEAAEPREAPTSATDDVGEETETVEGGVA